MARKLKGKYRRSTPVIRMQRNIDKLDKIASLVQERLLAWKSSGDETVEAGVTLSLGLAVNIKALKKCADLLEQSGFVPPARPKAAEYETGEKVRVKDEFRPKYESAYRAQLSSDPDMLDELSVSDKLPTGELVVRRTPRSIPIIMRKSHVSRCSP